MRRAANVCANGVKSVCDSVIECKPPAQLNQLNICREQFNDGFNLYFPTSSFVPSSGT